MSKHKNWLNIAEEDMQAAEWCFKGEKYLWTVFMCQQSLEKAIKAIYIYKNDKNPPRKHDLLSLSKSAEILDILTEENIDLFTHLNLYYIETRYPEKREELKAKCNKQNTLNILNQSKEMLECLKNMLKK